VNGCGSRDTEIIYYMSAVGQVNECNKSDTEQKLLEYKELHTNKTNRGLERNWTQRPHI